MQSGIFVGAKAWCDLGAGSELWTADFKGQIRTRNWNWCHPLTMIDRHSRSVLALQYRDGPDCGRLNA